MLHARLLSTHHRLGWPAPRQTPSRRALRCVATATDDLLVPAPTDRLPPPPSQRPRFDDEDTPTWQQRHTTDTDASRQPPRSRTSAPRSRRTPPLPPSISEDLAPQLIEHAVARVSAFLTALDAADIDPSSQLHELRAGMLGNDRPPATMRRSQLIHAAYVAGHCLKQPPPSLSPSLCREAQGAAVCLLALGANAPHAPSYPQLRKLLTSLQMAEARLRPPESVLLAYTVLRTLANEQHIVPLAKALDVWQGAGVITHADQEQFAQLLAPRVVELSNRAASGLSPALASDVCEAAAQCFAVWSRVRYLPSSLDTQLFMELITRAAPHASAWQASMILRNAASLGVRMSKEHVDQWTLLVNDLLPRASTADRHKCPQELDLDALLTPLSEVLTTMSPSVLVAIPDALGNMGLASLPAAFDQEAFGEAVNANMPRMRDQDMGLLLRGLLKANCVPLTLDFDLLGSRTTALVERGMQLKDVLSVLLFFQQLQSPPPTLNITALAAAILANLHDMSNADLMRALRALGALKVASRQSFGSGLDLEALGTELTRRIDAMEPRELVQLAPLVGRLRLGPLATFDAELYQQRLAAHLDSIDAAALGSVMLGLGSMGVDALHNKGLQGRMLQGVESLRYKELSMLVSSLARTSTVLSEAQQLALGAAFNSQMRHFSPRQMSGSLWAFARMGGLPPNFDLHSAEHIMRPALATMRSNEVCSVLSGLANMYGTTTLRQQWLQQRTQQRGSAEGLQQGGADEDVDDEEPMEEESSGGHAHVSQSDPVAAKDMSQSPFELRFQPSVDFVQEAVNVLASRSDLPRYLSSLLWACSELRVRPGDAAMADMAAAVPAMVAADAEHMGNILLHLSKLRIPMPVETVDLVLRGSLGQAKTSHDVALACFAAAMLLADNPDMLPALQPALLEVVNAAVNVVDTLTPDDARQLLTLHYAVAMAAEKKGDAHAVSSLVPEAVLSKCRALQQGRTQSQLQVALIAMAPLVADVESVDSEHVLLDGIIRMAAVCRMTTGEVVGVHTSRVRPAFRNTMTPDGPASLRAALLTWKGLRVAQLHGRAWLHMADDAQRLAALTKAVGGGEDKGHKDAGVVASSSSPST